MTSLSFLDIDRRFPGASVYWDRDVAGEGWDPVFVERDGVLWAQSERFPRCFGPNPCRCRCRAWIPNRSEWWTHRQWQKRTAIEQLHDDIKAGRLMVPTDWRREFRGQLAAPQSIWLNPDSYRKLVDIYRHAPHRWRTIRQVLGRNTLR